MRNNLSLRLEKFFTNNGRFEKSNEAYKKVYVLNVILSFMLLICLFFVFANILIRMYSAAAVNAAAVTFTLLILVYFKKTDNYKTTAYFAVAILILTLTSFFYFVENRNYAFYWLAILPSIVFLLLESKKAIIVVGLYCGYILFFFLFNQNNWAPAEFNTQSIINIAGATFSLVLMIAYSEKIRKDTWVALKKTNAVLENNQNELRTILDTAAEGIFGIDTEGKFTFCNRRCLELLGYSDSTELIGKDIDLIYSKEKDGLIINRAECDIFRTIISGEKINTEDKVFWRSDSTYIEVEYFSFPMYMDNQIVGAVITFMDISEKKRDKDKLQYMYYHDSLTGLMNRKRLSVEMRRLDNEKYLPLSIVYCDLNGLKLTNDIFGHEVGDSLILSAAGILTSVSRKKDIVARIGGDEFVWLLPNTDSQEVGKVLKNAKHQMTINYSTVIRCSIAMGSHTRTALNEPIEQTLKNAENEMYRKKSSQKKCFEMETLQDFIEYLHEMSPYEKCHSENVSYLCETIGIALNLSKDKTRTLRDAGYYHDIGKISLSKNLIGKTASLTPQEKLELEQHPVVGFRLMNLFSDKLNLADSIYSHHERWDGSGYPKGLKGEEIPKNSRIIAIAEQYDHLRNALTDKPMDKENALSKIRQLAGIKLDPQLTELFFSIQKEYD